jgi:hypothetical protein
MTAIRMSTPIFTALAGAALAGITAGVATACLHGVLPAAWNTAADSGAVWTVVAFAVTAALARTQVVAALAGLLALLGEVAGYYLFDAGVAAAGRVEILLATGFTGWALAAGPPPGRSRVLAAGAGLLVAAAVYLAYRLPTLG